MITITLYWYDRVDYTAYYLMVEETNHPTPIKYRKEFPENTSFHEVENFAAGMQKAFELLGSECCCKNGGKGSRLEVNKE